MKIREKIHTNMKIILHNFIKDLEVGKDRLIFNVSRNTCSRLRVDLLLNWECSSSPGSLRSFWPLDLSRQ
ncbi:hypothetical protein E1A91_D10G177800v1 [Gossypium mustelinum]|uniref:Uncharacterized protein n=5 Tax=Gossypium TaxID=3633 RepID=A0A0D2UUF2_GOSRA|nr:hypothetical protein ES319_D10G173000v1 [Gossypium barbadense]KJB72374.1 hypothetical protein B456_011G174700 [Gossypium raimondii]TYI61523.1 hypothetical protein E1A91_D10G177800v1 [Gossypium mustelinum]